MPHLPPSMSLLPQRFPKGGLLLSTMLTNQGLEIARLPAPEDLAPILGLYQTNTSGGGRIAVYGDSSCFDDTHAVMETGNDVTNHATMTSLTTLR